MLTIASFSSLGRYDAASRIGGRRQLSDEQWLLIEDLFPWEPPSSLGGRPAESPRTALEAILWLLRNGRFTRRFAFGVDLPTAAQGLDRSRSAGRSLVPAGRPGRRVWRGRLGASDRRRHLLPGEKKGNFVGIGRKGKGTTALVLMDGDRTPLGIVIAPASEHEVRHIERLLDAAVVELPEPCRLLYDGAADSDPLRERLEKRAVNLICPHRANRVKKPTQGGRTLRRRRYRWRIERTTAWLHSYGRIIIRKDRHGSIVLGWLPLACLFAILKRF